MPRYTHDQLAKDFGRFRKNTIPGSLMVVGLGELGSYQQVICQPAFDTRRHPRAFERDDTDASLLYTLVRSRRGNPLGRVVAMQTVALAPTFKNPRPTEASHVATTSTTAGEFLAGQLRRHLALKSDRASLQPEDDKYHTWSLTSVITTGIAAKGPQTELRSGRAEITPHIPSLPPAQRPKDGLPYTPVVSAMLDETFFEPGVGIGFSEYSGNQHRPHAGDAYVLRLGQTAMDTVRLYREELLGHRRGMNIAVKEITGKEHDIVLDLALSNQVDL